MAYLYRGVHARHPGWEEARKGTVKPAKLEGTATASEHNLGLRLGESPYTSWTPDIETAKMHRDMFGKGGILLRVPQRGPGLADQWAWAWSPDEYLEDELLLKGLRMDAEVIE